MDEPANAVVAIVGLVAVFLGGRVLTHVVRNHLARIHAIRSIPLPRHTTLLSGKPSGQIEAVFLDAFDTEHRRQFDGEPNYERYSAQEVAELRVFLLGKAFQRVEPRILYEIEVGVPLLRKLEDRDSEVCAWADERLKANRLPFGKPYTINDLILKPSRFRWFLWTCGIGASQVLFFERVFHALPVTVVPRRLAAGAPSAKRGEAHAPPATLPASPAMDTEDGAEVVAPLAEAVRKKIETGIEGDARTAIADARREVEQVFPGDRPATVRDFIEQLRRHEERLDTFDEALAVETKKDPDHWAPWLRDALAEAQGGKNLSDLNETDVMNAFERNARRRWVTDFSLTASAEPNGEDRTPASENEPEAPEIVNAPANEERDSSERNTDKASEMGF